MKYIGFYINEHQQPNSVRMYRHLNYSYLMVDLLVIKDSIYDNNVQNNYKMKPHKNLFYIYYGVALIEI